MTRPRPRFRPEPRIWTEFQLACRLGRSEGWLRQNRARLEAEGFPPLDSLLGGTDAAAVERWLDNRAGLERSSEANEWLEAIHGTTEDEAALR